MTPASYHSFKIDKIPVLFLVEYKQAFIIQEDEYEICKESKAESQIIINKYIRNLDIEESEDIGIVKDSIFELYLCVANDCNANCCYCFAGQGSYGKKPGLMNYETSKKAIDFFFSKVPKEGLAIITFFGGEPLLAYDLIEKSCEYINFKYSQRKYEYHMTTNATLLDEKKIDFLVENDFKLALSIDGGSKIQNKQRPLRNGKDSYIEATKYIPYLLEKKAKCLARGTYMDYSVPLYKCYSELLKLGFVEVNIIPDILDIVTEADMKSLILQLEDVYKYILKYMEENTLFPFGIFKRQIRQLFLPVNTSHASCGAGKTTFAVDINGDIFPCHRYSGVANSVIGNVHKKLNTLDETIICLSKYQCKKCWNRNTCSHGCSYENYQNIKNNRMAPYFCNYAKKMTELAIGLCMHMDENQLINLMKKNS